VASSVVATFLPDYSDCGLRLDHLSARPIGS
jgi:hypothetical protein